VGRDAAAPPVCRSIVALFVLPDSERLSGCLAVWYEHAYALAHLGAHSHAALFVPALAGKNHLSGLTPSHPRRAPGVDLAKLVSRAWGRV